MSIISEVVISSPITVANLGGFDLGGMALRRPSNNYVFQRTTTGSSVQYLGKYGQDVRELMEADPSQELVRKTIGIFAEKYGGLGVGRDYNVIGVQEIPLRRGSGASAAARGAAWLALYNLNRDEFRQRGIELTEQDIIGDVAALEGHWDNTAPNILGGYVYIVPENGGKSPLIIGHRPIPYHEEILVVPDFFKESTDVLRPPVQAFRATGKILESALYKAGMVFASTGSYDITPDEMIKIVSEHSKGAGESVPMPELVSRTQQMIRYIHENYKRARVPSSTRLAILGENLINDGTHVRARADVKGYGPFTYSDFIELTKQVSAHRGFIRVSGAGPNHAIAFDRSQISDEDINAITDAERAFWRDHGLKEPEFFITRPAESGAYVAAFSSDGKGEEPTRILSGTLEALLTRL